MGACIRINPPPPALSITLPGGGKIQGNKTSATAPSPATDLWKNVGPAFGAMQPIFDVVGFGMSGITLMITLLSVIGALMALFGNPMLAAMFPVATIINTDDNVPIPGFAAGQDTGVPDLGQLIIDALNVLCSGMKLVGIMPQVSMLATVKDAINAALTSMSEAQAKINSLNDQLSRVPADTGDAVVDRELACAREAIQDAMAHAMGPISAMAPMMNGLSILAAPVTQGLPSPVVGLIEVGVNLGLIPFPDDAAKAAFLASLEPLKQGVPLNFTQDTSSLPTAMDSLRANMAPIVVPLEAISALLAKLQNC